VQLTTRSDVSREVRQVDVPFSFSMTKPVNQAKRLGLFLALLVPGLLIPLLLAYVANWLTARFQPVRIATSALVPVIVKGGGLFRRQPGGAVGESFHLSADDFDGNVPPTHGRARRIEHRGYEFRARTSASPFSGPHGEALRPGWLSAGRLGNANGPAARLGLALPGMWVVSIPAAAETKREVDEGMSAEVLMMLSEMTTESVARMSAEIRENAPAITAALCEQRNATQPSAGEEPAAKSADDDAPWGDGDGGRSTPNGQGSEPSDQVAGGAGRDESPPWDQ
jgi:hypothetical protein